MQCLWGSWCPFLCVPWLRALGGHVEDIKNPRKAQAWLTTVTP